MNQSWREEYKSKLMSLQEAVKLVKDGDKIYFGTAGSVPYALADALYDRKDELNDITLFYSHCLRPFKVGKVPHFKVFTYFLSAAERDVLGTPKFDYTSFHLSQVDLWVREIAKPNVVFLDVSLPDENGYCSLGISGVTQGRTAIDCAERVIVQVNKHEPYVLGEGNLVHISEIDAIVEYDDPLVEYHAQEVTDPRFVKIANTIAEQIPDGACIQFGGGKVIDAMGDSLFHKNDLGIHTEVMNEGMMRLMKAGNVTNARKGFMPGKTVTSFMVGGREFYDFVDKNEQMYFAPLNVTNNPHNIAANDNFISVNSCLYIDLLGQVVSESINGVQYTGIGGQVDFVRGAQNSKGGKSFLTCSSTYENRQGVKGSHIVPFIPPRTPVTTSRADVHYICTEYGCVNLKLLGMRDRTRAIISLAHPDFRDELTDYAKQYGLL